MHRLGELCREETKPEAEGPGDRTRGPDGGLSAGVGDGLRLGAAGVWRGGGGGTSGRKSRLRKSWSFKTRNRGAGDGAQVRGMRWHGGLQRLIGGPKGLEGGGRWAWRSRLKALGPVVRRLGRTGGWGGTEQAWEGPRTRARDAAEEAGVCVRGDPELSPPAPLCPCPQPQAPGPLLGPRSSAHGLGSGQAPPFTSSRAPGLAPQ